MKSGPAVAAMLLAGALLGCQREAPAPSLAAPPPAPSAAAGFIAEGDALLAAGDAAGAVTRYERAVAVEPENIAARYGLGTALSHLDRVPEATVQFQWVMKLGGARSPLVPAAQAWLAKRNALPVPPTTTTIAAPPERRGRGRVSGRLAWRGLLGGADTPVEIELSQENIRGVPLNRRTSARVPGEFRFEPVTPGHYRLIVRTRNPSIELWNRFVVVEPGGDVVVELTTENAAVAADTLPLPDPRTLRGRGERR